MEPSQPNTHPYLHQRLRTQALVTWAFVILCVVVYLLMLLQTRSLGETIGGYTLVTDQFGRVQGSQDQSLGWYLILDTAQVANNHEWWRIFTAAIVHLDIVHILMNSIMILLLGTEVEKTYGHVAMLCTIIAGASGGALACMMFQPESLTGGASTVAYALCALLVAVTAQKKQPLRSPLLLIGVNLGFTMIMPGISLWGHVGGLVAGIVLAIILYNPRAENHHRSPRAGNEPFSSSRMSPSFNRSPRAANQHQSGHDRSFAQQPEGTGNPLETQNPRAGAEQVVAATHAGTASAVRLLVVGIVTAVLAASAIYVGIT